MALRGRMRRRETAFERVTCKLDTQLDHRNLTFEALPWLVHERIDLSEPKLVKAKLVV